MRGGAGGCGGHGAAPPPVPARRRLGLGDVLVPAPPCPGLCPQPCPCPQPRPCRVLAPIFGQAVSLVTPWCPFSAVPLSPGWLCSTALVRSRVPVPIPGCATIPLSTHCPGSELCPCPHPQPHPGSCPQPGCCPHPSHTLISIPGHAPAPPPATLSPRLAMPQCPGSQPCLGPIPTVARCLSWPFPGSASLSAQAAEISPVGPSWGQSAIPQCSWGHAGPGGLGVAGGHGGQSPEVAPSAVLGAGGPY